MITFERIAAEKRSYVDNSCIDEANIFQTEAWLKFVADTQKAEPVTAAIKSNGSFVGYYTGLIVKKSGIKVLGSPFRGWLTYFMGLNLLPGVSRCEILQALPDFAFKQLGCHYLELIDPLVTQADLEGIDYLIEPLNWFAIDLTQSEDELLANMKSAGRNCIRKSIKNDLTIEEASDLGFAEDYFDQLQDVFEKQSLSPVYDLNSLKQLIQDILPTGQLLLLRAKNPEGICIATGIFLALNRSAVFWGAASWRQYQHLRPNELLAWYGIRNMKARGVQKLHFGGLSEQYKKKLGCEEIILYRLMKARYGLLDSIIKLATSPKSSRYRNWMLRRL